MNWKTLRSIRFTVDLFAVIGVLGFLLPWFLIVEHISGHTLGFPLFWRICILVFWGRYLTRFVQFSPRLNTDKKKSIAIISYILFSALFLFFLVYSPGFGDRPDDVFAWFFIGIIFLLWGIKSGTDDVTASVLHRVLMTGAVSFAIFFYIVFRIDLWQFFEMQSVPYTLGWFLLVILALGLYRILDYSRSSSEPKEKETRLWSPFIGTLAIICVMLAVISSLAIPGLVNFFRPLFRAVLMGIQWALNGVLWVFAYIASGVIYLLNLFLRPVEWEIEMEGEPEMGFQEELAELAQPGDPISQATVEYITVIVSIVVFAIIAYIILALVRNKGKKEEDFTETRESLASADAFSRWAAETLQGVKKAWSDRIGKIKKSRDYKTATEIYNAQLMAMSKKGYPKPGGITPNNFQNRITKIIPGAEEKTDNILRSFSREYYAGQTISPEKIQILREDLKEVLKFIGSLEKKKD